MANFAWRVSVNGDRSTLAPGLRGGKFCSWDHPGCAQIFRLNFRKPTPVLRFDLPVSLSVPRMRRAMVGHPGNKTRWGMRRQRFGSGRAGLTQLKLRTASNEKSSGKSRESSAPVLSAPIVSIGLTNILSVVGVLTGSAMVLAAFLSRKSSPEQSLSGRPNDEITVKR